MQTETMESSFMESERLTTQITEIYIDIRLSQEKTTDNKIKLKKMGVAMQWWLISQPISMNHYFALFNFLYICFEIFYNPNNL